jgi:hypothetical protein
MALEPSIEDEAFVLRMTDDNEHWVRQDISHTVSMLRKLSCLKYEDDSNPGQIDGGGLPFKFYLERYKIFIEARKDVDRNHPTINAILKRMAAMIAPLEELLDHQEIKDNLGISESTTPVDTSGLRQRRGRYVGKLSDENSQEQFDRVRYLLWEVIRDIDKLQIYILMGPPKYV